MEKTHTPPIHNITIQKQISALKSSNNQLLDNEKEYQLTIKKLNDEIDNLKLKCLDIYNYEQWNSQQIVAWMISLDEQRFNKYRDTLLYHLNEEEIIGNDLKQMNEIDLQRWHIKSFNDKSFYCRELMN